MTKRKIIGYVRNGREELLCDYPIYFWLNKSSYSSTSQFTSEKIREKTDATGKIDIDLWCNSESLNQALWMCCFDNEIFSFILEPGKDIEFSLLRSLGTPSKSQDISTIELLKSHLTNTSIDSTLLESKLQKLIDLLTGIDNQTLESDIVIKDQLWFNQNNQRVLVEIQKQPDGKNFFKITEII